MFGSARFPRGISTTQLGREVGRALVQLGFTVMTGGGPGVMEAANRGAQEAGGRSVGCNITLAHEQYPNAYLDRYVTCHYFFVRKVLLFKYSYAFVVLPGGLGTLDELTEALTLIQTGKIHQFPVVLMGAAYWKPFTDLLKEMVAHGTISVDRSRSVSGHRQRDRCDGAHRAPRDPPVRPAPPQGLPPKRVAGRVAAQEGLGAS